MKIQVIKFIDRTVGALVAACLPAKRPEAAAPPRRVLFIRPGGIGDAVLLVPAILALKRSCPEARITILAERRNCAVFSLCAAVNGVLVYDQPAELLKALRGGFDVVIDSEQWHRLSAVVTRLTGAPHSIGFATNGRKRLFTHPVGYSHDDYEMASFFNLLAPLGITPSGAPGPPFLTVPEQAVGRAAELLPTSTGKPRVAIFPGASIAERRWGAERFRMVAEHLSLRGCEVAVVGGKDEAGEGETIVKGCGGVNLAGRTTLAETAAVISGCALLLSGDSGVLHLAVGLGVPTVSLFGPGIEAKWGPKGERDIVLNRRLSCSPCTRFGTTPRCSDQSRCLAEIPVEEVVAAIGRLISGKAAGSDAAGVIGAAAGC